MGGSSPVGSLGLGAAGGMFDAISGRDQASAIGAMSLAQQKMAKRQLMEAKGMLEAPTVAAMANFDTAIQSQERNLARQEKLIGSIDPAILEASQQALALLRGEESKTLSPLKAQRDMQRQKLVNNLREQMGPGAETSTAGMQALNRFDMETSSLYGGAQQQALGNLGAIAGQFTGMRPDMLRENLGLGQLGSGRAGLRQSQLAALQPFYQNSLGLAGAGYAGDLAAAQGKQAMWGGLLGLAGTGVGAMMGGPAGAKAGSTLGGSFGGGGITGGSQQSVGGNSNLFGMSEGYGKF